MQKNQKGSIQVLEPRELAVFMKTNLLFMEEETDKLHLEIYGLLIYLHLLFVRLK